MSAPEAVAVNNPSPWTEDDVARAIAFALRPFLAHEFGAVCDDQALCDVSAECARIAVATFNEHSFQKAREAQ